MLLIATQSLIAESGFLLPVLTAKLKLSTPVILMTILMLPAPMMAGLVWFMTTDKFDLLNSMMKAGAEL